MRPRRFYGEVWLLLTAGLFAVAAWPCAGQKSELKQPPPLDPVEGRRQARKLLDNLLQIRPAENMNERLLFRIADQDGKEVQVPVHFEIVCTPTNFLNIYETVGSGESTQGMKLTIAHDDRQPNEYWLSQPAGAPARKLCGQELWLPFAGSDFSAADLGLEFLHWPDQRVIRNQMRRYVFCQMLESINPHPVPGGYSKVVSWIGANRPDELVLVHADAYDARGKLLKVFEPTKLEKVQGVQELQEMRIWNRQTDTNTKVEFRLQHRGTGE